MLSLIILILLNVVCVLRKTTYFKLTSDYLKYFLGYITRYTFI